MLHWSIEEKAFLNPIQIDVCQRKADYETFKCLEERFQTSKSTIYSILIHIIEESIWRNGKSRNCGFLGDIDSNILINKVKKNAQNLNCLRTFYVMQIAVDLKNERYGCSEFLANKLLIIQKKNGNGLQNFFPI